MRIVFPIFLLFFLLIAFAGQQIHNLDAEKEELRDIVNFTENIFDWDHRYNQSVSSIPDISNDYAHIKTSRMNIVLNKFVDFIGTALFELAKLSMEFGYDNPHINYESLLVLAKYYLIVLLIFAIGSILTPIIVLVWLIVIGLTGLFKKIRRRK